MAIGDVVDPYGGQVITPADPAPAGGGGGGAPAVSGDGDSSAGAFGYGVIKGTPGGAKIAAAGVPIAMRIGNALNWLKGGPNADQIKAMGGLPQDYTSASEALATKGGQAAEEHPWIYGAGQALPMIMTPGATTAKGAAIYGGSLGAGEAESPGEALVKGTLGAAGGAGSAALANAVLPAVGSVARQTILDAAKRLKTTMPRYSVGLPVTQMAGKLGFSIPGAAAPLEEATGESIEGLSSAAERTAAGATKQSAASAASSGLKDWIGPISRGDVDAKYNAVTQALTNPNATTPLSATQSIANRITANRGRLQDPSGALQQVQRALDTGEGTYNEIKALRSSIGEQLAPGSILPAGVQGSELKQIYDGLSSDLERAAYTSGGQTAVAAHNAATAFAKDVATKREQLTKLLGGPQAGSSDEAVFGAIKRVAGTTDSANIALLRQAKNAMPAQSWDELSRGMVSTLGRDGDGNFSTAKFITDYGKISDDAKAELFGHNPQLQANLDDLKTVSQRWKDLGRYANPTHSGMHAVGPVAMLEGAKHPAEAITAFLGFKAMGKFLASPAGAGATANWTRAVSSGNAQLIRNAAVRTAATAGAQLGAKVDPMPLAALALEHYLSGRGEGAGDQSGNQPQ